MITKKTANLVKEKHKSTCHYCGAFCPDAGITNESGQVDHFVAKSCGGSDDIDNLVWSCGFCNYSKNRKNLEDWRIAILIKKHYSGPAFTSTQAEWLAEKYGIDIYAESTNKKHLFYFER